MLCGLWEEKEEGLLMHRRFASMRGMRNQGTRAESGGQEDGEGRRTGRARPCGKRVSRQGQVEGCRQSNGTLLRTRASPQALLGHMLHGLAHIE